MIRAVIFDFDGVILDSAQIKTQALKRLFQRRFPEHLKMILAYHKKNMGVSRFAKFKHIYDKILCIPLSEEREKELGQEYSRLVFEEVLNCPLVPGALEFLEKYRAGYLFFVASSTPQAELDEVAQRRRLRLYFRAIHGAPLEKPDILRGILSNYGLTPQEVIFVGDAESDRDAAAAAGVAFVGLVRDGNLDPQTLKYALKDLVELEILIERIHSKEKGPET